MIMETRDSLSYQETEPNIVIEHGIGELQIENDNLRAENLNLKNKIKELKQVNFTTELENILSDAAEAKKEVITQIVTEKKEAEKKINHLLRLLKEAKKDHEKLQKRISKLTHDVITERNEKLELKEKIKIDAAIFKKALQKHIQNEKK